MGVANISGNILTDSGASLSSYLPLTGGTLTGALSGTSATFSGAMRSNGIEITNTTNADILDIFQSPSVLNSFIDYPSGRSLILRNKGSQGGLTLASTGAATFSSSVTAGGQTSVLYSGYDSGAEGLRLGYDTSYYNAISATFSSTAANNKMNLVVSSGNGTRGTVMTLQGNGNVGIGTSSITNGTAFGGGGQVNRLKVESGNYTCLEINGSTSGGSIQFTYGTNLPNQVGGLIGYNYASGGDMGMYISNKLNGGMAFATNDTERMRITSSGVVLITSSVSGQLLNVNNTRNNGSGDFALVTTLGSNDANTNNYHYIASTGGTDRFYVYGNGNVVNTNNSYGPLSDIKLKENITDATPKLDKLMQVRIVNYNLKSDLGYETNKQIGVIAQELEHIFPALVDEHIDRDSEGNDLETTTKSVKMSVFIPILIKSLQESHQIIKDLEARIVTLESKIN